MLRGRKHTTREGGIRIPFIVQWKGHLPAKQVYEHPVIQLDVIPTCLAAAGGAIDPAWKLDGINLLPYLKGENSTKPHPTLYWRIDGMWAIRHGDWKLVHGEPDDSPPVLFDLAADISEQHDQTAANPAKVQELRALWTAWNNDQAPPQKPKAKTNKKAIQKTKKNAKKTKTDGQ